MISLLFLTLNIIYLKLVPFSVHLTGIHNGKVFEDRDVQFSLGEGEDCGVIEGVEKALESFKSGEKSRLKIKSKYAYKNVGKPEFDIPPNATVEYTVELKSFEKVIISLKYVK